jgi:hypothetical protein
MKQNSVMGRFAILIPQFKEDGMGGTCSRHGTNEKINVEILAREHEDTNESKCI